MNSSAKIARWVAVAVSAVWAAVLYLTGLDLDDNVRRWMMYLPSVVGLAVVAFDLWLWKLRAVSRVTGRPHVYGTWRATLRPSSDSLIPEGGNREPVGAMVIEQTFWTTSVQFYTDQSASSSATAALVPNPDSKQTKNLYFTYTNRARQEHSRRSYPHHGTALLRVAGTHPNSMDGNYWTDRLTAGDLNLELLDRQTNRTAHDALAAVVA